MTNSYDNVFINSFSSVCGPFEKRGKLGELFDKSYDNFYMGEDTFEKAEFTLIKDSLDILFRKGKIKKSDVDLFVMGDLNNQIVNSCNAAFYLDSSFVGCYAACASNCLGIIIGSNFINSNGFNNCIVGCSSHNMAQERQFRNPTEYGAPKPNSSTFTSTGATSLFISNKKSNIKISSSTLGKVMDLGISDVNHMGAVMAPAAADTIYKHLFNTNSKVSDYDLILTGDLGIYGKKILVDYMNSEYNIDISSKLEDCGCLLYSDEDKSDVHAGGSGPACSSLVVNSYILPLIKKKKYKKVLYVATGALFNPVSVFQGDNIKCIAHAVCLEAC